MVSFMDKLCRSTLGILREATQILWEVAVAFSRAQVGQTATVPGDTSTQQSARRVELDLHCSCSPPIQ